MTAYELRQLQAVCQAVLDKLVDDAPHGMAVNWGDLHCITAERWEDHEGNTGYRVWIEEADDAVFEALVMARLVDQGWTGVDVRTEW